MKKTLFLFFIPLMISCVENPPKETSEVKNANQTNVQKFVAEFENSHPQWVQNSILEDETNKKFTKKLDSFLKTPTALADYRFKLESINEYKKGKYAVKLVYDENNLNIELIGTVKDDLVKKISEDNFYSVDGKYIKNLQDLNPYYDYGLWNVSLGKNKLLDSNDVYFGVNLYQIANLN